MTGPSTTPIRAGAPPAEFGWAGPLAELLTLPGVTDVLVHAPGEAWLDRGGGLERVDLAIGSPGELRALAVRLAALAGRRLDDAAPCVDARLPNGARLHAVLPPVADGCAAVSVRVVPRAAPTLEQLERSGSLAPQVAAVLRALVHARASVLVTGATGAGKTTLLASLLTEVPPEERIVLIEEAGEARPTHPHVVRLVERRPNVDGAGAVTLAALVREALRMRPDRIVLGECRGAELREVLLALNTGHRGGMATLHANSAADVPARLVALGALAGMTADAVALHAAAGFDAVIHLQRGRDGMRRVREIAHLMREDPGLGVRTAVAVAADGTAVPGQGWPALAELASAA